MKMIDVTNSHFDLVNQQLANTDAQAVRVYTIGPTTVVYSHAPTHDNLVLVNHQRPLRDKEVDFAIQRLFEQSQRDNLEILEGDYFIEIERRHLSA